MNAGVSEIDGLEQAAARLNEIVEELPIVEPRTRNELVLPENNSMVRRFDSVERRKTHRLFSFAFSAKQTDRSAVGLLEHRGVRQRQ